VIALFAPRHRQEAKLDGGAPLLPHLEEEMHSLFVKGCRLDTRFEQMPPLRG
jgi:hypothetical protein